MPVWILSLWSNPLARKCAIYAAAGLAIFFALRLYGNRQWSAGEQAGRIAGALELEEAHKAEWEAERKALAADSEQVARDKESLQRQRADIERSRLLLNQSLQQTLKRIESARVSTDANIITLPPDALDDALRTLSAELAAATH